MNDKIDKMWEVFNRTFLITNEDSVFRSCHEYGERIAMIKGIVVNKTAFKQFDKLPSKPMPKFNGMPYEPMNAVKIYSKPYFRGMRICYTEKQLREVLNGKNNL